MPQYLVSTSLNAPIAENVISFDGFVFSSLKDVKIIANSLKHILQVSIYSVNNCTNDPFRKFASGYVVEKIYQSPDENHITTTTPLTQAEENAVENF